MAPKYAVDAEHYRDTVAEDGPEMSLQLQGDDIRLAVLSILAVLSEVVEQLQDHLQLGELPRDRGEVGPRGAAVADKVCDVGDGLAHCRLEG